MVAMLPTISTSWFLPSSARAVRTESTSARWGPDRRRDRTCSVRLLGEADVDRGEQREDVRLQHRDEDLEEGEREGGAEGEHADSLDRATRLDEQVVRHGEEERQQ